MFRIRSASTLLVALAVLVGACSWDNPVWPKDPRSHTPLFRFVIGVGTKARAGYIDSDGRVVIPANFETFGSPWAVLVHRFQGSEAVPGTWIRTVFRGFCSVHRKQERWLPEHAG